MDKTKLAKHAKLCWRNLRSARVKCCASCPFEEEISREYLGADILFIAKRRQLGMEGEDGEGD